MLSLGFSLSPPHLSWGAPHLSSSPLYSSQGSSRLFLTWVCSYGYILFVGVSFSSSRFQSRWYIRGGAFPDHPTREPPPPAPCSSFLRAFSFPPETGLSPIISYLAKQQKGKGHIWVVPCHRSRDLCHSWPRVPVSESSSRECLPVALLVRAPGEGKKSFWDFK